MRIEFGERFQRVNECNQFASPPGSLLGEAIQIDSWHGATTLRCYAPACAIEQNAANDLRRYGK